MQLIKRTGFYALVTIIVLQAKRWVKPLAPPAHAR